MRANNTELLNRSIETIEALTEAVQTAIGDFEKLPELAGKAQTAIDSRRRGDPQADRQFEEFMRDLHVWIGRKATGMVDKVVKGGQGAVSIGKAAKSYVATKPYRANHDASIRELANNQRALERLGSEYRVAISNPSSTGSGQRSPERPSPSPPQPYAASESLSDRDYSALDEAVDIMEVRDKGYRSLNGDKEKLANLFQKHPELKREVEAQFGLEPSSTAESTCATPGTQCSVDEIEREIQKLVRPGGEMDQNTARMKTCIAGCGEIYAAMPLGPYRAVTSCRDQCFKTTSDTTNALGARKQALERRKEEILNESRRR